MKRLHLSLIGFCVIANSACSRPPSDGPARAAPSASPNQSAGGQQARVGVLNFPTISAEKQKEIKSLKRGEWVPVKIDRNYLILRGGGIRIEHGDYFVQLLSDSAGKVTKFLLAKKRGTKVTQVDFNKGSARDRSFATVLDFVAEVEGRQPYTETRAYVSSSGESAAVWVHLTGSRLEWRGELMGLAGPSDKLVPHQ